MPTAAYLPKFSKRARGSVSSLHNPHCCVRRKCPALDRHLRPSVGFVSLRSPRCVPLAWLVFALLPLGHQCAALSNWATIKVLSASGWGRVASTTPALWVAPYMLIRSRNNSTSRPNISGVLVDGETIWGFKLERWKLWRIRAVGLDSMCHEGGMALPQT